MVKNKANKRSVSRKLDFDMINELVVGDRIGVLVSVCAELIILKNDKEVLAIITIF